MSRNDVESGMRLAIRWRMIATRPPWWRVRERGGFAIAFLVALALALLIAGPALGAGQILVVDHVFGPRLDLTDALWNLGRSLSADIWFTAILQGLTTILGNEWVDRVWLLGMLAAGGAGAWTLAGGSRAARVFAMTLFLVNPWVYDRLWAGQWTVILAYAMAPWAVWLALGALERRSPRRAATAVLVSGLALSVSQPLGLLLAGALMVLVVARLAAAPDRRLIAGAVAALSAAVVIHLHWIVQGLAYSPRFETIGENDLTAFATRGDETWGLALNVLGLYGFWREILPSKDALDLWPIFALVLIGLGLLGWWACWRSGPRWLALAVAIIAVVAFLFALGDQGPTGPLFRWAFDHVPGFKGFREPGKATGLLALVYAWMGARGLDVVAAQARALWPRLRPAAAPWVMLAPALALVVVYGHREFYGQFGDLQPSQFPEDWYEARAVLDADPEAFQVLALPWHLYLHLSFGPDFQVVSNPAPDFFGANVIRSTDPELIRAPVDPPGPQAEYVEEILRQRETIDGLGNLLVPLGVKYVLLMHEADAEEYTFMERQEDLRLLLEGPTLSLYLNERFAGYAYQPANTLAASDLPAQVTAATTTNFRETVFMNDPQPTAPAPRTDLPVTRRGRGPVVRDSLPGLVVIGREFDPRLQSPQGPVVQVQGGVVGVASPGGTVALSAEGLTTLWALRGAGMALAILLIAIAFGVPGRRRWAVWALREDGAPRAG